MADKKVTIDILVNTAGAAGNLKEIKNSLKDLKDAASEFGEGTEEFERVSQAAADLKDRLDDVNDAIKSKKGTGFEKFGGELGILGDKLGGLDFKGANESIGRIATQFKSISFKDIIEGVKGFTSVLVNLGKAILANPIFLIAAIIIAIGVTLYALKDKVKIIGEAFEALGAIIGAVVQFFKDLSDAIGLTSFAAEEAAEKQIAAGKKAQAATEERYDAEKRLAKAAGKDVEDIELKKQEALRETINQQIDGLNKLKELNGKFSDDQKKEYEELQKAIRESNLVTQETILAQEKKTADDKKKADEEQKKRNEKAAADAKKAAEDRAAANATLIKQIEDQEIALIKNEEERAFAKAVLDNERAVKAIEVSKASNEIKNQALLEQELTFQASLKAINDKATADKKAAETKAIEEKKAFDAAELELKNQDEIAKAELAVEKNALDLQAKIDLLTVNRDIELQDATLTANERLLIQQKYSNDVIAIKTDEAAKAKALKQQETQDALNIGSSLTSSLSALSDVYFNNKRANLKKGSAEELAAAKKQFNISKALAITGAVIDAAKGITSSLASAPLAIGPAPNPLGIASLAAVVLAGVANVAKIASTKFTGGESGGGSGGGAPSAPAGIAAAAVPNVPPAKLNDFSLFGTAGKANNASATGPSEIRAVVLESDITASQKKVNNYKTSSEL